MISQQYRRANELADLIDFEVLGSQSSRAKADPTVAANYERDIASLRADLAEQERIDGKPADTREQRQGFLGAT